MRTQTTQAKTKQSKRPFLILGAIVCVLLIATGLIVWKALKKSDTYVPPVFDSHAVVGTPDPEETLNYGTVSGPTGFSVSLCGTMYQQEDSSLIIYFTNPIENNVNLQCAITNETGDLLYKSGVIRPGEYVERLTPVCELPTDAVPIIAYVYSYEDTTWYSMGTMQLSNVLQPY